MITIKKCKFCNQEFFIDHSIKNESKKKFCNPEHQQEYWRYERNITGNFSRRESSIKASMMRNKTLNNKQFQVCIGGLLGDSNLNVRKNGSIRIKFGHTELQKEYLLMKMKILDKFIVQKEFTLDKISKTLFSNHNFYIFNSICHKEFKNIYPLFYRKIHGKNIKFISMNTLNKLDTFGLLIWFLDDGHLITNPRQGLSARIATNCFTLPEHRMIKKWFWKKFRIQVLISPRNVQNKETSYFIRFNSQNTKNLMKLFSKYYKEVPECMKYKLLLMS